MNPDHPMHRCVKNVNFRGTFGFEPVPAHVLNFACWRVRTAVANAQLAAWREGRDCPDFLAPKDDFGRKA